MQKKKDEALAAHEVHSKAFIPSGYRDNKLKYLDGIIGRDIASSSW